MSIAEQINLLFEVRLHPDRRSYTLQEVSAGTGISLAAISQLRGGRIHNPQLNTVRALCHFFDVPLRYFEAQTPEECYAILNAEQRDLPKLSEIAFRAADLSEASQQDLLTIIQWIRAAEERTADAGLPPMPRLGRDSEPEE
jgi:transcriptional regulator with XRE-family HTH domain